MGQNKNGQDAKVPIKEPPVVEDKSNDREKSRYRLKTMIMDVSPGKKGCATTFPWGGRMTVPPGIFNKKEKLIAKLISPTERHIHSPPLQEAERLLSELFLLVARNYKFSSAVQLEIPIGKENLKQRDMVIRTKPAGEQEWSTIDEYQVDSRHSSVKFETQCSGLFAVTSMPRTERFEVTPQGCLYNARINRYISVRFPKKATDRTMTCEIRIRHVHPETVDLILTENPQIANDILSLSHFYDIRLLDNEDVTFRRGVSIKLPNTMCQEEETDEPMDEGEGEMSVEGDIAVLHKTNEGWKLIEQTLKFTQTSVSFDVKALGRFCLVRTRPDRIHRTRLAIPIIEEKTLTIKGEVMMCASLCERTWRLLVDVMDQDMEPVLAQERMDATWNRIEREEAPIPASQEEETGYRYRKRVMLPKDIVADPQSKPLVLRNGVTYKLHISGDIKPIESTPEERLYLQYHQKLTDNFTYFDIAPLPVTQENGTSGLTTTVGTKHVYTGCVSVFAVETASDENKENVSESQDVLVRKYLVRYDQKQLDDYYYVEPEKEDEKKKEEEKVPEVVIEKPVEEKPKTLVMNPAMTRLTRPKQPPPKLLSKEPKVLSGRSLKILSAAVEHGLTLAVHLNLPDSTITGIGFDSIANGLSMQEVTYKVLMHWKRTFKGTKEDQVKDLVDSIKDLGRMDVSAVLMDRYRRDVELSPDCFDY